MIKEMVVDEKTVDIIKKDINPTQSQEVKIEKKVQEINLTNNALRKNKSKRKTPMMSINMNKKKGYSRYYAYAYFNSALQKKLINEYDFDLSDIHYEIAEDMNILAMSFAKADKESDFTGRDTPEYLGAELSNKMLSVFEKLEIPFESKKFKAIVVPEEKILYIDIERDLI